MSTSKLAADLDRLIQRAASLKASKLASDDNATSAIDSDDDGTVAVTTGEHARKNQRDAGRSTTPAGVDADAETNPANASVENSTELAVAGATDGQSGPKTTRRVTVEGPKGGSEAIAAVKAKVAALREAAQALRKAAEASVDPADRFFATALQRLATGPLSKTAAVTNDIEADAERAMCLLSFGIAQGLVSDDEAAQIIKEAMEAGAMTPEELELAAMTAAGSDALSAPPPSSPPPDAATSSDDAAQPAVDQSSDEVLLEAINNGAVSDEEAAKLIEDGLQNGYFTQEDIAKAQQTLSEVEDEALDTLLTAIEEGRLGEKEAEEIITKALEAGLVSEEEVAEAARVAAEASKSSQPVTSPSAAEATESTEPAVTPQPPATDASATPAESDALTPDHPQYFEKLSEHYTQDFQAGYDFFSKLAEAVTEELESSDEDDDDADGGRDAEVKRRPRKEIADGSKDDGEETPSRTVAGESTKDVIGSMMSVSAPSNDVERQALKEVQKELGLSDQQVEELLAAKISVPDDAKQQAKVAYRAALLSKIAQLAP